MQPFHLSLKNGNSLRISLSASPNLGSDMRRLRPRFRYKAEATKKVRQVGGGEEGRREKRM